MFLVIASIALLAYLLGSIPFGLLVANSQGVDIRAIGSKNIGATNVWRMMGRRWGLLVFFADAAKGWLAVWLAMRIAAHWPVHVTLPHLHEATAYLSPGYAGITAALGCILGHNFPVWLKFKGGKGVATSLGVIFGMMPLAAVLTLAVWGVILKLSRYVSLASIMAAVALPIIVLGLMFFWPRNLWGAVRGWEYFYFACAAALLVVRRHRENIRRLMEGSEHRFGTPKTAGEPPAAA